VIDMEPECYTQKCTNVPTKTKGLPLGFSEALTA
jgi:hypothetical protein